MNKSEAQKILFECAELYRDNLIDCNLLFVCMDRHKKISTLEVQFLTTGFMHLTGVKFQKERIAAGAFFDKCINKRLALEEFEMAADGTTEMIVINERCVERNSSELEKSNSFGVHLRYNAI